MDRKRLVRLRDELAALEAGQTNAATFSWIKGDNHGASAAAWSNPEVRIWLYNNGGVTSHAVYANAQAHVAQWEASWVYVEVVSKVVVTGGLPWALA